MAFFQGRVSFARFHVAGPAPRSFTPEHVGRLRTNAIGSQKVATADGVEVGWITGDHVLDSVFTLEKNIVNDALHFALRIDTNKPPTELVKAQTQIELAALAERNSSGRPSAKQKREAREMVREMFEDQAKDGRFLKRKMVPVLWDAASNELLVATTSATVIDRVHGLFAQTFGQTLALVSAGHLAYRIGEANGRPQAVDNAVLSTFAQCPPATFPSWQPDETARDFLGNEFLTWLWFTADTGSDTIKLADGSEAAFMLARSLRLDCPRGETGKDGFASDAPTRLPEARRALRAGKLPRKSGLTVVRHDQQYEFALTAEAFAVGSCRLPACEAVEDRPRLEERVTQIRSLLETLDLMFEAFCRVRLQEAWTRELVVMRSWVEGKRASEVA